MIKKVLSLFHKKKIHARPKLISNPTTTIESSSIWFSAPSPPWIDLPTDVTANILQRLGAIEILESAQFVCATWWKVCHEDPSMWRVIDMIDPAEILSWKVDRRSNSGDKKSATMCCHAVNRSQGGLIDIRIGSFCTGNLLLYISDRSSRLKRLTIAPTTWDKVISGGGLTAAVKKWGELEEFHLGYSDYNTAQVIEAIGKCCPLLNTFSFNNLGRLAVMFMNKDDSCALAIAKNMPNLRHLELSTIVFTEKGLQGILDGCPCLESLDFRGSGIFGLEEGDFQNRCSWIKDLGLPFFF